MAEAGGETVGLAAQATNGEVQLPAQLVEVATAAVLQLTALEQVPDAFVRIEFRSVGGQAFEVQPLSGALREELLHRLAAMDRRAIPNHEQLAAHLPQQLAEKADDRGSAKGLLLDVREEAPVRCEGADHGEVVMGERGAQDRRLADRRVGAGDEGQQVETRLVYEEDRAVLLMGFA